MWTTPLCTCSITGLSEPGVPGLPWHPRILADQLTLSQPGADYAHHIMYYLPPRIFKPSYGPALLSDIVGLTWKCYCSQFLWKFFIKWEVLQTHAEHNWRVKPFAFPNGIPLRNLFPIFNKFWWHSSTGQISTLVGRIRWGILPDFKKNSWNFMCKKYDEFAWIEGRRSSDLYI